MMIETHDQELCSLEVRIEELEAKNERLRAERDEQQEIAGKYEDRYFALHARVAELEAENERLRAALNAVKGFCRYCGATYPHRLGEGRCERCAAVEEK